jgi:hypothetical protein
MRMWSPSARVALGCSRRPCTNTPLADLQSVIMKLLPVSTITLIVSVVALTNRKNPLRDGKLILG